MIECARRHIDTGRADSTSEEGTRELRDARSGFFGTMGRPALGWALTISGSQLLPVIFFCDLARSANGGGIGHHF